jgi:hypothetical protein
MFFLLLWNAGISEIAAPVGDVHAFLVAARDVLLNIVPLEIVAPQLHLLLIDQLSHSPAILHRCYCMLY